MTEPLLSKAKLERRPLNATELRILEVLRQDYLPFSAYDLMDRLRGLGVRSPNTVYRALNRLVADRSVHRLETLNAYVACKQSDLGMDRDPMFAICDTCGSVEEFEAASIASSLTTRTKSFDFALNSMTVELRGTCRTCRPSPTARSNEV
ncbi:MAG: transcriptional repressor [Pseudomonadota bacterium]